MIVKIDDIIYGLDIDGHRWAVPVADVVIIKEQQGWDDTLGVPIAFASVWTKAAGNYLSCSIGDTVEDVHMMVYGVPWPEGAPTSG